jgi:hypothetical protein
MPGSPAFRAERRLGACSHVDLQAGTPGAAGERVRQHGIDGPATPEQRRGLARRESGRQICSSCSLVCRQHYRTLRRAWYLAQFSSYLPLHHRCEVRQARQLARAEMHLIWPL